MTADSTPCAQSTSTQPTTILDWITSYWYLVVIAILVILLVVIK